MRRVLATGLLSPVAAAVAGGFGVWAARDNVDAAPAVVGAAILLALVAAFFRERGVALCAVGVGAAAAFVSPAGLGPLLVVAGVCIAAQPAAVDRRVARVPELVDGLVALPGLAGLAGVVAAQPSARGLALGAGTGAVAVLSWWRGPRHRVHEPEGETVVAYLGAVVATLLVFAPELFDVLGVLPAQTRTTGRGLAAAFAVFALTAVAPAFRRQFANRTNRQLRAAAHRR